MVCSGAEPAAVTDCLNFGNPETPDRFWQFKNCVTGISDTCKFFNISVVSGNVSFYNESPRGAIYPTPTIGMIGIIEDTNRICVQHFKNEGDEIVLLGACKEELGGSEYLKVIHKLIRGDCPDVDLRLEKSVQYTVLTAIRRGLVNSAHDCSEGGLAVALSECCISNKEKMIGATITNLHYDIRKDALLFGESQSRIILSCSKGSINQIKEIAGENKTPFQVIGNTGGKRLKISDGQKKLINLDLEQMRKEWSGSIRSQFDSSR